MTPLSCFVPSLITTATVLGSTGAAVSLVLTAAGGSTLTAYASVVSAATTVMVAFACTVEPATEPVISIVPSFDNASLVRGERFHVTSARALAPSE